MPFERVSILGVGLLGGSIGLALRARSIPCRILGFGHRRSTLDRALQIGAIDRACDDPPSAVSDADLVILATPVGLFESMLRGIAPALKAGAVVTDVGSTKRSIVKLAARLLPPAVHFVPSHPMAGSERRGIDYARADLFTGMSCILTPTRRTNPAALQRVDDFWQSLGMNTVRLSPQSHDRLLAEVSHLPHAVAAALVLMQDDRALPLAGKGFLDTTRIAGGDGALWRDILIDNADHLRRAIRRLRGKLDGLLKLLNRPGGAQLAAWLDRAAARRQRLLASKLREMNPD